MLLVPFYFSRHDDACRCRSRPERCWRWGRRAWWRRPRRPAGWWRGTARGEDRATRGVSASRAGLFWVGFCGCSEASASDNGRRLQTFARRSGIRALPGRLDGSRDGNRCSVSQRGVAGEPRDADAHDPASSRPPRCCRPDSIPSKITALAAGGADDDRRRSSTGFQMQSSAIVAAIGRGDRAHRGMVGQEAVVSPADDCRGGTSPRPRGSARRRRAAAPAIEGLLHRAVGADQFGRCASTSLGHEDARRR